MAKTRLPLTPVTIEVDNPTSSTAGDVCIEEMSQAGYICDVGGKVNLNDECELMANPSGFPGSESGIIVGNTTNLSLAPLDV